LTWKPSTGRFLPAAIRSIRLPTWSPRIDRVQLLQLAAQEEAATWLLNLKKGVYRYSPDGSSKRNGSFKVT